MEPEPPTVDEQTRTALVRAALTAYEDALLRGLCREGAWEVALAAMRDVDLSQVTAQPPAAPGG